MARETDQLLAVANRYLAEARRMVARTPDLASMTIGDITRRHRTGSLSPGEVTLAHLASAAIRLATICEIARYRPTENYRRRFYEPSGKRQSGWTGSRIKADAAAKPEEHLHLLLRDNPAHEEPGIANNKEIAAHRFAILKTTTIGTCSEALGKIAKRLCTSR